MMPQQQQQQQQQQPGSLSSLTSPSPPLSVPQQLPGAPTSAGASALTPRLYAHVLDLTSLDKREQALLELSKKREEFPDLAPILWHSFGTIAALLQEIVSIYPLLSPPRLTPSISNRCCNALALLQCVASHAETRNAFLNSHLGLFLYPFLNTVCTYRQYEYLRLTSLGVIGALVKMDDTEVISFLLQTEIIPLCFPELDTRVLTNAGFLFLDEIETRLERGEQVLYACYDIRTKSLVYSPGNVVKPAAPSTLLDFTAPEEKRRWIDGSGPYGNGLDTDNDPTSRRLSLRVTPAHRMYCQLGNEDKRGNVSWSATRGMGSDGRRMNVVVNSPSLVSASSLLSPCRCPPSTTDVCVHRRASVRFVACAENGINISGNDGQWRSRLMNALCMNAGQLSVFLNLFGFFLGDGSMAYRHDCSGYNAVRFNQLKPHDHTYLAEILPRCGLLPGEIVRYGNKVYILASRWFKWFDAEFGRKYPYSEYYVAPAEGEDDYIKSVKWLPDWALFGLNRDEIRDLLEGLRRAQGSWTVDFHAIYTSSAVFRDQLVMVMLHAGYSPYSYCMYPAGTLRGYNVNGDILSVEDAEECGLTMNPVRATVDAWAVCWGAPSSTPGKGSCWPHMRRQEAIHPVPYSTADGRIWCVTVNHPDHLIFAQRAERNNHGVVTKQSRPIIVGNCLRIMDNGSELSKTVATFIIQKILLDEMGLNYICATYERFSTVSSVLSKMVAGLIERPSVRLLKHIVRCYLRLSDNTRARDALRGCLPLQIRDMTFAEVLKDDPVTKRWLAQLLFNIGETQPPPQQQQQAQQVQQPSQQQQQQQQAVGNA